MNDLKINELKETDEILRSFLNNALKEIMSAVKAECGSLFLFDSGNKELVLNSFYNSMNLHLKGLRQKIGEGISGKVVDIKQAILVKDITNDSRFRRNGYQHYRTNSFIAVPLYGSKGLLLGIINLADKSSGEPFSENDLEVAVTIARYACLTIDTFHNCAGLKNEKEALDKQKLLLEKYASVGKLAAGVVHEINNPLDGVIRYANILLAQMEHNSIAREYLLEVKKGLSRIANITKSLLDFSHQVNATASQIKKYVNLHELIEESLDEFSERLNGNIQVNKQYAESLPRILDLGLSHIFINVIKNALDAMPEGGNLEISTNIKGSFVEINFKDTGLGIPQDIKERIFEPFFTTKSIDKGTGLGLAICNEVINKYEGRINVESLAGEGSQFTVLIPKKYLENA